MPFFYVTYFAKLYQHICVCLSVVSYDDLHWALSLYGDTSASLALTSWRSWGENWLTDWIDWNNLKVWRRRITFSCFSVQYVQQLAAVTGAPDLDGVSHWLALTRTVFSVELIKIETISVVFLESVSDHQAEFWHTGTLITINFKTSFVVV